MWSQADNGTLEEVTMNSQLVEVPSTPPGWTLGAAQLQALTMLPPAATGSWEAAALRCSQLGVSLCSGYSRAPRLEEELRCPLLTPAVSLQATTNWTHSKSCAGMQWQPHCVLPKVSKVQPHVP